jgi:hypothetical protein
VAIAAALAAACAGHGAPRAVPDAPALSLPAPAPGRPERLVVITVHGLAPERYFAEPSPPMPTLAALARAGAAAESVVPAFPASAYPAHATLLTGVGAADHGIGGDRRVTQSGVGPGFLDQATDLRAATFWQAAARQGVRVAALDWPSTGGAEIADLAPDLDLATGASWLEALGRLGAGRAAEMAGRAGGAAPENAVPGASRDAALVTMACALLVGESPPGLVLVRLSQTHTTLDGAAPGSLAARAAFASVDAEIGRLARCLDDAGLLATSGLVIAGDHGVAAAHTAIRPNVALAEVGLLVPEATGSTRSWDAIVRSNGGSAFVYAGDAAAALLARRALEDLANETGAFRVLSAQEMLDRSADPEAWFGLEAEPGFVFEDAAGGGRMVPASSASAGGYGPLEPRIATGLVLWGPRVRAGIRAPLLRQIDVAPTLAAWIGLDFATARGRAVVGLFTGGAAR